MKALQTVVREPRRVLAYPCGWLRARLSVFDWSRSVADPNEFVLVEAFVDDDTGAAHVGSDHFAAARREFPPYLAATPKIVNASIPAEDWSELGEMAVD